MEKKQIIGLVVAAIVFVAVCSTSVITKSYSDSRYNIISDIESIVSTTDMPVEPFVGVVRVEGTILNTASSDLFYTESYNHTDTLSFIEDLQNSDYNRGIVLYIDSPGGGVYESDELYLKLKQYSDTTARPIWTYMASQACSGGYYIAMASDLIFANRNTWTGSIGVIMSLSNYKDLFDKIGIKTVLFTSGPNKAIGNGGTEMTPEQSQILQSLVDESYSQFLSIVSDGRNMDIETLKPIADGRIYTAQQALDLNLIDDIVTYEDMVYNFRNELQEDVIFYTPKKPLSKFSSLFGMIGNKKSISNSEVFEQFLKTERNGVPMYYETIRK